MKAEEGRKGGKKGGREEEREGGRKGGRKISGWWAVGGGLNSLVLESFVRMEGDGPDSKYLGSRLISIRAGGRRAQQWVACTGLASLQCALGPHLALL